MTKTRAFAYKYCQNISASVAMTKTRAFAYKCCQDISASVGMTKTRAFAYKCCQNCTIPLYRNNISRASPENKSLSHLDFYDVIHDFYYFGE